MMTIIFPSSDFSSEELNKFKNAVFYSTFFQRLEEFTHIYASSKKYMFERELIFVSFKNISLSENLAKMPLIIKQRYKKTIPKASNNNNNNIKNILY